MGCFDTMLRMSSGEADDTHRLKRKKKYKAEGRMHSIT